MRENYSAQSNGNPAVKEASYTNKWLCHKIQRKFIVDESQLSFQGKTTLKYTCRPSISKLALTFTGRNLGVISASALETSL